MSIHIEGVRFKLNRYGSIMPRKTKKQTKKSKLKQRINGLTASQIKELIKKLQRRRAPRQRAVRYNDGSTRSELVALRNQISNLQNYQIQDFRRQLEEIKKRLSEQKSKPPPVKPTKPTQSTALVPAKPIVVPPAKTPASDTIEFEYKGIPTTVPKADIEVFIDKTREQTRNLEELKMTDKERRIEPLEKELIRLKSHRMNPPEVGRSLEDKKTIKIHYLPHKRNDRNEVRILKNELKTDREKELAKLYSKASNHLSVFRNYVKRHFYDEWMKHLEDEFGWSERIAELEDQIAEIRGSGSMPAGDHAISNHEIDGAMSDHPEFQGCYMSDEKFPFKPGRYCFIVNTDKKGGPGIHWCAVNIDYRDGKFPSLEYYDPFGQPCPDDIFEGLSKLPGEYRFKENLVKNQSVTSQNCGRHCLKFLQDRLNGDSFKEATGFVQQDNSREREKMFKTLVGRGYYPDTVEEALGGCIDDANGGFFWRRSGPKYKMPRNVKDAIKKYGNWRFHYVGSRFARKPIQDAILKLGNSASLGALKSKMNELGYDNIYHLYSYLKFVNPEPNGGFVWLKVEKNEKAMVQQVSDQEVIKDEHNDLVDHMFIQPVKRNFEQKTLKQLFEDAEKRVGAERLWRYDISSNNCQRFILDFIPEVYLSDSNRIGSSKTEKWIRQDVDALFQALPAGSATFFRGVTDLYRTATGNGRDEWETNYHKKIVVVEPKNVPIHKWESYIRNEWSPKLKRFKEFAKRNHGFFWLGDSQTHILFSKPGHVQTHGVYKNEPKISNEALAVLGLFKERSLALENNWTILPIPKEKWTDKMVNFVSGNKFKFLEGFDKVMGLMGVPVKITPFMRLMDDLTANRNITNSLKNFAVDLAKTALSAKVMPKIEEMITKAGISPEDAKLIMKAVGKAQDIAGLAD